MNETYNPRDSYFKDFKRKKDLMDRLKDLRILGELSQIRAKEMAENAIEKSKEVAKKVGPVVEKVAKNPYAKGAGQIGGALTGGYLLGDTLNKYTESLTGKSLSDRIYSPNMDDGKYDPNRAPNPAFLEARAEMDKRRQEEEAALAIQNFTSMMDEATGSRDSIPYRDPQGPYSASPVEEFGYASDPLNRVRGISSFMETPNEATAFSDSGLRIPNLTEEELDYLKAENDKRLIAERGYGQPLYSGYRADDSPYPLGGGTFGNEAALTEQRLIAERNDPTAPFVEGQIGAPGSPISAISDSLRAMGPDASNDERTERAASLIGPYLQTTQAQRNAENAKVFAAAKADKERRDAELSGMPMNMGMNMGSDIMNMGFNPNMGMGFNPGDSMSMQPRATGSNLRYVEAYEGGPLVLSGALTPDGTNGIQSIGAIKQMLRDTGAKASTSHARVLQQKQIDAANDKALERKSQILDQAIAVDNQRMKQMEFMMNVQTHQINMNNALKEHQKLSDEDKTKRGLRSTQDLLKGKEMSDDEIAYIYEFVRDDKNAKESMNLDDDSLEWIFSGKGNQYPLPVNESELDQAALDEIKASGIKTIKLNRLDKTSDIVSVDTIKDFPAPAIEPKFEPKKKRKSTYLENARKRAEELAKENRVQFK